MVDSQGRVWFTDEGLAAVGVYNPSTQTVTEYDLPGTTGPGATHDTHASPVGITVGPDGNIWFAQQGDDLIGMIDPNTAPESGGSAPMPVSAGVVTVYASGTTIASPTNIVTADGKLWITDNDGHIGEFDPSNTGAGVTVVALNSVASNWLSQGIAVGSDGDLWVGVFVPGGGTGGGLVRVNPGNPSQQTLFPTSGNSGVLTVTAGSDGNIWVTEGNDQIGMLIPDAPSPQIQQFSTANSGSQTDGITAGPDGNVWFTDHGSIGSIAGGFGVLPATQLVVALPSSITAGSPFSVTVTDRYVYGADAGTTDTLYNGSVTLQLASGPGSLGGTLTAQAVNGVATFPGLTIGQGGSYTIQANAGVSSGARRPRSRSRPRRRARRPRRRARRTTRRPRRARRPRPRRSSPSRSTRSI